MRGVIRGSEGTAVFAEQHLEAAAGIRQPMGDYATTHPGVRILEPPFMEIRQAVGTPRSRSAQTLTYLHTFVESLKAEGFIADALRRSGRRDARVAPPAGRASSLR